MRPLGAEAFATKTQFKQWTFNDIPGHPHAWNRAADLSLAGEAPFDAFIGDVFQSVASGSPRSFEQQWLAGLCGRELLEQWHGFVQRPR